MKQLSESKILITGNNGFLGRAIVSFINNHYPKSHLFLLDNVQDKSNYNFASKSVIADLCDPTAFSLLESDFDYVFHLASYTSREVEECFDKGLNAFSNHNTITVEQSVEEMFKIIKHSGLYRSGSILDRQGNYIEDLLNAKPIINP